MISASARADVPLFLAKPGEIKVDGVLRDWGGTPFFRLDSRVQGSSPSNVRAALAYDATFLYVAAQVVDPSFVRTNRFLDTEDHAELLLSFPNAQGQYNRVFEVKLFAGKPGETEGQVKAVGLGPVRGAEIVEAPSQGGYTFEAKIPWSVFPPAAQTRVKLRGALRYLDGDGRGTSAIIASAPSNRAADLPLLLSAPEQALVRGLINDRKFGSPTADIIANVAGDSMTERVLLFHNTLVVYGPTFRKGTEYFWSDITDPNAGQLPLFDVRDLTGDGKSEIIVVKRVSRGTGWRQMLQVLSFRGDSLQPIFEHETGLGSSQGTIENKVSLVPSGQGHSIVISLGSDSGYDASTYHEPQETEREPLLLPWGTVQSRTYAWDGKQFVKRSEQTKAADSAPARPAAPPPPRPPSADELLDQVYRLYKKDHNIPEVAKPTFDFVTNVAASQEVERIICHGRDLVVFGKGFREGRGYVSLSMPQFVSDKDIHDVSAFDVTGDGLADIIVRGSQRTKAPEELGQGELVREVLFVYRVDESSISRVFAAETAVTLGSRRIYSLLAFVPSANGLDIEIRPGRAIGWTRATWPYRQDTEAVSGLEPIVLPWTEQPFRFRFAGQTFSR
jgi:hypothetical protein